MNGFTPLKWLLCTSLLLVVFETQAAESARVGSTHLLSWGGGLILVLGLFFFLVWILRKSGSLPLTRGTQIIQIIGGLSLGMREKLLLVQVGKKQVLLGLTPGRIENLLVLDGDDLVDFPAKEAGQDFATQLQQILSTRHDH